MWSPPPPNIWDETFIPPVIDLEASGFGRGSYPLEVGLVLGPGQTWCTLVRPEPDWVHWDETSARLHGIPRDILLQRGKPVQEVAAELNRRLRGRIVYSDAWGNDLSWLSLLFDCAETVQLFQLESLRRILPPEMQVIWEPTRTQVSKRLNLQRHRASTDARVLQLTWLQCRQRLLEEAARPKRRMGIP